jgi:hypothetical protein
MEDSSLSAYSEIHVTYLFVCNAIVIKIRGSYSPKCNDVAWVEDSSCTPTQKISALYQGGLEGASVSAEHIYSSQDIDNSPRHHFWTVSHAAQYCLTPHR